jgi:hypothetical protein
MATEVLDREKLINEIWTNKGKVGLVAQRLGVTTATIYNYAKQYATVKNALDNARLHADEILVDTAELKLHAAVMNGQAWAIRYTLGTKGKERGYTERQELEHSGGFETRIVEGPRDVR